MSSTLHDLKPEGTDSLGLMEPPPPAPRERDGYAHGQKDGKTREGEPVRA